MEKKEDSFMGKEEDNYSVIKIVKLFLWAVVAAPFLFIWYIDKYVGFEGLIHAIAENDLSGFLVLVGLMFGLNKGGVEYKFQKAVVIFGSLSMLIGKLLALSLSVEAGKNLNFESFFGLKGMIFRALDPAVLAVVMYSTGMCIVIYIVLSTFIFDSERH